MARRTAAGTAAAAAAAPSGRGGGSRGGGVRGALATRARDALFDLAADLPRLLELDVAAVRPNPDQPRRTVDEAGLAELAASIERHGLLQPVAVREDPDGGGYMLVAGQRRLLAHARLGRPRIAALVVRGPPDELALVENLQRQDLAPLDEAAALAALRARHGYRLDDLARALGKARSTVSELLSLDGLPEAVKAEVRTSERPVAKSVLVELAREPDERRRLALWRRLRRAGAGGATVREARAARDGGGVRTSEPVAAATRAGRLLLAGLEGVDAGAVRAEPALRDLLDRLRARLGDLLDEG